MNCVKKRQAGFQEGFEEGRKAGVNQCVEFMMFSMIQYLGDKRGWKRERIMEAIQWIAKHAIMIDENYTTYPEVRDAVKEDYGIICQDGRFILLGGEKWQGV